MRRVRMHHKQIIPVLLGLLAGSPVLAQDDAGEPPNPCTVEPIYHCAEAMDDGSYIAHFGYRTFCPESSNDEKPIDEVNLPIGDDNYFAPERDDRGQPTVFRKGEHIDEFESEYTADDIKEGKAFAWTVLKIGIPIDFSKTKDASLDCNKLTY